MPIVLRPKKRVSVGDVEVASIDYTDWLDTGELLTGTPSVTGSSSHITIANISINTSGAQTVNGRSAGTSKVVRFKCSGWQAENTYLLSISTATDATVARTVVRDIEIEAV